MSNDDELTEGTEVALAYGDFDGAGDWGTITSIEKYLGDESLYKVSISKTVYVTAEQIRAVKRDDKWEGRE